jgi:hypothetical protein
MPNDPTSRLGAAIVAAVEAFIELPTPERRANVARLMEEYEKHIYKLGFEGPDSEGHSDPE